MTRRKVMIRFVSERSGLSMNGLPVLFEGETTDGFEMETEEEEQDRLEQLFSSAEDEPDVSEMLVEGRLITTTHRVELVYEEAFSSEFGSSVTRLGFDRACPEMITMLRSGAVNTALVFENKKRHICIYNIPAAGFEVCISTVRVDNRILTDGVLVLDYYMEVHGVQTDHCKLELTIQNTD